MTNSKRVIHTAKQDPGCGSRTREVSVTTAHKFAHSAPVHPLTLLGVLVLFSLFLPGLCAEPTSIHVEKVNDSAAFLAGIRLPHQSDHPLTGIPSWSYHARVLDQEFQHHQDRVLDPMTEWSNAELSRHLVQGSVVRYLFSGPDILHAIHLFPTSSTFILCGLEPVGEIPDLSQLNSGSAERALEEVRTALGEILKFSFFRTNDMKEDLQLATFHGTTPIMMVFLIRCGQYIRSVEYFQLNQDGTLIRKGQDQREADAVKIEFSAGSARETKTLYYFSSDLSDGGFPKTGLRTWLEKQPRGNAYLKAASFLLHKSWFKSVRQHLIDYSYLVVQDDSGIPFRYFDESSWQADLFGSYSGPIDLFAEYYQSDLYEAYLTRKRRLSFGTGYKWVKGESNLMRFLRQDASTSKEELVQTSPSPAVDE